ncbi:phage holin family protein [soil metagenome]
MGFVKSVVITFIAIFLLAMFVPAISYTNWGTLIVASIVLTILQKVVQPVLKILFLPINIITLGLFSWVINLIIIWLVMLLVPGFHINNLIIGSYHLGNIFSLLLISFALSLIESVIDLVI